MQGGRFLTLNAVSRARPLDAPRIRRIFRIKRRVGVATPYNSYYQSRVVKGKCPCKNVEWVVALEENQHDNPLGHRPTHIRMTIVKEEMRFGQNTSQTLWLFHQI